MRSTHTHDDPTTPKTLVIGGGLAGLAAATALAQRGRDVMVLERSDRLGGMAQTEHRDGFCLNLGPHALYRHGVGYTTLDALGVRPDGAKASQEGARALFGDALHALPAGPWSLLRTTLLDNASRWQVAKLLAGLARVDTRALGGVSLAQWAQERVSAPRARALLFALARLSTYAHAPERLSAGVALGQLQHAARHGVDYLHGGWGTLVNGLAEAALAAGARMLLGARVARVEHDDRVRAVWLNDGRRLEADAVVVALPLKAAARVLGETLPWLSAHADTAAPVRLACLDVGLRSEPEGVPRGLRFMLGVDRPLYVSTHSDSARVAPEGMRLVHVARYLAPDEALGAEATREELEAVMERAWPGWRERAVVSRFMPRLRVCSALDEAANGGLAGRPAVEVPGVRGLALAGDWVGGEGVLADASLASGLRAAGVLTQTAARAA